MGSPNINLPVNQATGSTYLSQCGRSPNVVRGLGFLRARTSYGIMRMYEVYLAADAFTRASNRPSTMGQEAGNHRQQ